MGPEMPKKGFSDVRFCVDPVPWCASVLPVAHCNSLLAHITYEERYMLAFLVPANSSRDSQAVAPGVLAAGVAAVTGNEAVKNLRLKNDASKDKLQRKPQPKSKGGN